MDNWEDNFTCPVCKSDEYVPPTSNSSSQLMIIAEFPGDEEIQKGIPMVGAMGGVLRTELRNNNVDMSQFQLANLWFHPKHKSDHPLYNDCLNYFVEQIVKEAKNKKAILLLGSDTVKYFCGHSAMEVCGLQVTSPYLSAPIIYACVNPAQVFHGGLGEVRLAIKKFSTRLELEGLI